MSEQERVDTELEEFRSVMEVPSTFVDGFTWSSLLGAIFIALLMVPGAIYMGLLAGQGIGPAAQWVTVILFIEVAKRAHYDLNRSEVFVLFFMAGAMMGGLGLTVHGSVPRGLLWQQFFARSDAAASYGIAEDLPTWFAPAAESASYGLRTFFHWDWLPVMGLALFTTFFSQIQSMVLGYGLFRVASDIEKLPFPMAPIGAMGISALAEDMDASGEKSEEGKWRWRIFSIGGAIGLAFGSIYLLLPVLTGALTGRPIQILPIPFSDFTQDTQSFLPAVATNLSWDLGMVITGMVLPFFAMLGAFIGLIVTLVLNPILYDPRLHILTSWKPGDDTITTLFKNNVDFYFSFQIGLAIAIALAGIISVARSFFKKAREKKDARQKDVLSVPPGRGDIPTWAIVLCYVTITMLYILVGGYLINWHRGVIVVLFILGFVYTPLISYVTARLEGMVGQAVEVPFIREASLIFSGYRGVACWFIPMPQANYGLMTVFYRKCELLGTKFTSIWKAKLFLYPIIVIASFVFMNFIWGLAEIPSAVYPFAQKMWELNANNACIMYSATLGEYSAFEDAFNGWYVSIGAGFGGMLFAILSFLGLPIFMVYGVVRGLGQTAPFIVVPQFIGALIGRYYFRRKLGKRWRQYVPVLAAGYACGAGLVTTLGVGITFLSKAVVQLPY